MNESEIRYNLQYDWEGLLAEVEQTLGTDKKRKIMQALVYEIKCYQKQSWFRRLFCLRPKHWLDTWKHI